MAKKKAIGLMAILLIGILVLSIVTLGSYVFVHGGFAETLGFKVRHYVECSVIINEELFGSDIKIESSSCQKLSSCGTPYSLFGFGEVKGTLQMYDVTEGSKLASVDVSTETFSGKDTVTISGCAKDESSLQLRLYNDQGSLQDTKEIK